MVEPIHPGGDLDTLARAINDRDINPREEM